MHNHIDTVEKLFEHAIELELTAQQLYTEFSRLFSAQSDVARFWKRYADEEKGHAAYLERIRTGVSTDRLSQLADEGILQKLHQVENRMGQVRLSDIKTLEDAYQLALEIENSETNAIFEFMIVNFSTDELAKSHQFLRTQLTTHIDHLENDLPDQYKNSATRQRLMAGEKS